MEILISILIGITLMEAYAWLDPLAKWLVRRAAQQLPKEHRTTFAELWTADLENIPNSLAKIVFAFHNCKLAVRDICDEIRRDAFESVADNYEELVESICRDTDDSLERSRSLLERSERTRSAMVSVLNRLLERLQNEQPKNPDAQSAIDRFRVLSPPVTSSLSELHARINKDIAAYEGFATRLREPLARTAEAILRIRRRLLDDRPIDAHDRQLLKSLTVTLDDIDGAFDVFE
jgi:hypothetical protein